MKNLDSLLLVTAGAVLGAIAMLAFSPYLLEVSALAGYGQAITGLKTGVGDIAGGLLGGVTAVAAAFGVFWLRDRKEERRRAEERAIRAFQLLDAVRHVSAALPQWVSLLSLLPTPGESFLLFIGNTLGSLKEAIPKLEESAKLAEVFGPAFLIDYTKLQRSVATVSQYPEFVPERNWDNPEINKIMYPGFRRLIDECSTVVTQLEAFHKMRT